MILIQKLDFESVWAKHHDAYIKNECIKSMERFYKSAFIRTRRGTFFQTLRTRLWSVFCQVLKSEKSQNKNVLTSENKSSKNSIPRRNVLSRGRLSEN